MMRSNTATPSWTHGLTLVFWIASILLAVLCLFGNYPGAPALHSLSLFKIDANNDSLYSHDRFTVGVYGVCGYNKQGSGYKLDSCSNFGRTPFYFSIVDVLADRSSVSRSAFQDINGYATTLESCMKAVWILLIIYLGINLFGLIFALVGIRWSSICREISVHLGIANLIATLIFCIIATVSSKKAVSKINHNQGDSSGTASFGGGGIVILWVLFVFCYLCHGFITVLIKRRNTELGNNRMNYDVQSEMGTIEGLSTPQIKGVDDEFDLGYSPSSTLQGTPQSRPKPHRPENIMTRPFAPGPLSNSLGPSTPVGTTTSPNFPGYNYSDTRRSSYNSPTHRSNTPNSGNGYSPYSGRVPGTGVRQVSDSGQVRGSIPSQYQHQRVPRLNSPKPRPF